MFTGLIEEIGKIAAVRPLGGGKRITVECSKIFDGLKIDDSVAINGVCLTVVAISGRRFDAEAVEETMRKTTFSNIRVGSKINLERAARLGDRMGGHLVQGHVDCTGKISSVIHETTGWQLWVTFPREFSKYIISSGSICIDGVSLTVARVERDRFMISIIPHTRSITTLGELKTGGIVNLEFDLIGKYVEQLIK